MFSDTIIKWFISAVVVLGGLCVGFQSYRVHSESTLLNRIATVCEKEGGVPVMLNDGVKINCSHFVSPAEQADAAIKVERSRQNQGGK